MSTKLMEIQYANSEQHISLTAYASTVILDTETSIATLVGIKMGGYAEIINAMQSAIIGGGRFSIKTENKTTMCKALSGRYRIEKSISGMYTTCIVRPKNELETQQDSARQSYICCLSGDKAALFAMLDRQTRVPLLPEFADYVLSALQKRNELRPCQVLSDEPIEAWKIKLQAQDKNIVDIVNFGLQKKYISIPNAKSANTFPEIKGMTSYLQTFGTDLAKQIRGQFQPLFDPEKEPISASILAANNSILKNIGYSLYDAQLAVAESIKRQLRKNKFALLVADCGSGKSKIAATALQALQSQNKKKHEMVIPADQLSFGMHEKMAFYVRLAEISSKYKLRDVVHSLKHAHICRSFARKRSKTIAVSIAALYCGRQRIVKSKVHG